jgi:GNAT superfamily N-acetyltransferase
VRVQPQNLRCPQWRGGAVVQGLLAVEIALVAEYTNEEEACRLAGIARVIRKYSDNNAEVAFLVADKFQNRGLGMQLLNLVIEIARKEGIIGLEGAALSDNFPITLAWKICFVGAGFKFSPAEDGVVTSFLRL